MGVIYLVNDKKKDNRGDKGRQEFCMVSTGGESCCYSQNLWLSQVKMKKALSLIHI